MASTKARANCDLWQAWRKNRRMSRSAGRPLRRQGRFREERSGIDIDGRFWSVDSGLQASEWRAMCPRGSVLLVHVSSPTPWSFRVVTSSRPLHRMAVRSRNASVVSVPSALAVPYPRFRRAILGENLAARQNALLQVLIVHSVGTCKTRYLWKAHWLRNVGIVECWLDRRAVHLHKSKETRPEVLDLQGDRDMTKRVLPDDLVSVEWLAVHLGDERVRVVDIRGYVKTEDLGGGRQRGTYTGAPEEYAEAHILGAVFMDWTKDIVDLNGVVKAQVAPPDVFRAAMESRAIGNDTAVVVVDHVGGHLATRLWWALRYYGHDDVAVLEGGYAAWNAAGLPLTADTTEIDIVSRFTPRVREGLRSDVDEVLQQMRAGSRQIVDARDSATYRGETQRGRRGGHIPGAHNLPAKSFVDDRGYWKSPEDILELAREAGVDPSGPVTAYCNGGVTATQLMFGLHRAGLTDLSNYDGSWNEWGEREDLPAESNRDLFGAGEVD